MLMRRQGSPLQGLRPTPAQFDLFAPSADPDPERMPEWRMLPPETRQALTDLIARLILDHARGDHRPGPAEERRDD
jgi:hypothetical protein